MFGTKMRECVQVLSNLHRIIFIIYLSRVLCLSYSCLSSCHPVTIAERSAILLVLIIKLTQRRGGGIEEGGIKDGEIGKGQIREGGCE